jgi:hypothetical protein
MVNVDPAPLGGRLRGGRRRCGHGRGEPQPDRGAAAGKKAPSIDRLAGENRHRRATAAPRKKSLPPGQASHRSAPSGLSGASVDAVSDRVKASTPRPNRRINNSWKRKFKTGIAEST